MRKFLLALLIAGTALSLLAAEDSDWYKGKPIRDFQFSGLDRIKKTELEGIIKPFVGKPFSDEVLVDVQRRLYGLEYFDYILPDVAPFDDAKTGVVVIMNLKERPTIGAITVRGNSGITSSSLMGEVTVKVDSVVSKSKIAVDVETLRRYYLKNGYANAKVDFALEDPVSTVKKNTKVLVFVVDEGFKTTIKKIQFSGNAFANEATLTGLMKSKAAAFLQEGVYQDENLELDKQAIVKYYLDNGYIDAKLLDVKTSYEDDAKAKRRYLTIVFYIEENERWVFGGINIVGNEIYGADELKAGVRSKPGTTVNGSRVQGDIQGIVEQYTKNGYINNGFDVKDVRDQATKTISYTITVTERGRVYIENIIIRGNTKTKDSTILRDIPLESGDIFSAPRIREGLLNLTNRRFFTANGIVPETPQGSAPGLYNLILNVTEGQTMDLRVGFAITGSSSFPLSGFIKWAEHNFLGLGQEVSLEANVATDNLKFVGSFSDPWLFGPNWSGGLSLTFERAVKSNIPQDILGPTFNGMSNGLPNGVPDPYTGQYVFTSTTTYKDGNTYSAGQYVPGTPTSGDVSNYGLKTDYDYAGGITSLYNSSYNMSYVNYAFDLGLNTGKVYRTPAGRFSWVGFGSVGINRVEYDSDKYRPWSQALRDNLNQWLFQNRLGAAVKLDGRDIIYDPSKGYFASETLTFTGGVLGGSRHYIKTDTQLEGYLTLWDVPINDNDNFKTVLAGFADLAVLFPQFGGNFIAEENLLYTNSMMIARGWPSRTLGQALFNSYVELRTPISPNLLSLDIYAEAVQLVTDRATLFKYPSDWMFGFGIGLRVINPSLPLRLYVGKRFALDNNGNVNWQTGNIFADATKTGSGVDLIFAFSLLN